MNPVLGIKDAEVTQTQWFQTLGTWQTKAGQQETATLVVSMAGVGGEVARGSLG